ncbi:MAG: alginate O-acetyltransferase complex protein AlgI [Crocinitomicaceae bacterium]|jgi:alginate O-acetyltransferase complex protein AlgI
MFVFLPVVLLLIGVLHKRFHNAVLLLASLYFYAWGSVSHTSILVISILLNYLFGRLIANGAGKQRAVRLGIAITVNLGMLAYLKYANFFLDNFNGIRSVFGHSIIEFKEIILPIGVSFFTFQAISYLVDVYRKTSPVQKNFLDLALYISLFPQLVAGPIVRYNDVVDQLKNRVLSMSKAAQGVHRFIIGFAKKILIANYVGNLADMIFGQNIDDISTGAAWLGITCYTLQIYFDFSGYSDMAIGLGKIFGFDFMENFNLPYIADSIRDFWRRWHISLSTWFRDYLYIPLGGNRKGELLTLRNLMLVFLLTGFWHGASWTFVIWGVYHGVFLLIERLGFDKILNFVYKPIRIAYTLLIVMIGWVLFRSETLEAGKAFIGKMCFVGDQSSLKIFAQDFLDNKAIFVLSIAIFLAFGFGQWIVDKLKATMNSGGSAVALYFVKSIVAFSLLLLSILYLAGNTYNPFIYFRF